MDPLRVILYGRTIWIAGCLLTVRQCISHFSGVCLFVSRSCLIFSSCRRRVHRWFDRGSLGSNSHNPSIQKTVIMSSCPSNTTPVDMSVIEKMLAPKTIDEVKKAAKDNAILTRLFPHLNASLDEITEENMSEDIQVFLRPDKKAHDRYAQLQASHQDGYATMAEMLFALTGKTPTPEYVREMEWFMEMMVPNK